MKPRFHTQIRVSNPGFIHELAAAGRRAAGCGAASQAGHARRGAQELGDGVGEAVGEAVPCLWPVPVGLGDGLLAGAGEYVV